MDSLANYGSDDDVDDSPDNRLMDPYGASEKNLRKPSGSTQQQDDVNYDEVQMSCSEDSDSDSKSPPKYSRERDDRRSSSFNDTRDTPPRDRRDNRDDRSDRNRFSRDRNDDKYRRDRDDDRTRTRDDRDDRTRARDDDKGRERMRDRDDDKRDRRDDRRARSKDRYSSSRDDRYKQDRDRRRSRSRDNRDRRRSRSPRRSRSRSRERGNRGFRARFDRANRMDRGDKDRGNNASDGNQKDDPQNSNRFFMPGITGRFRDQIEKRKLLWQKKEPEASFPTAASVQETSAAKQGNATRATKIWENTTFAQDTDGKVANKFKRLMGIKTPTETGKPANEVLKKQDEMFSVMEQQYEVARTTTHTMRGVGLGFSSLNR